MKIGAISLGCDKNRVDSEKMLARLAEAGHTVVSSEEEADVIIVNTCAFIKSAKEESIDEILGAVALKAREGSKRVIVTGCLSERYKEELESGFPEVDAFLGVADYDGIVDAVNAVERGERFARREGKDAFFSRRMLTTPAHYAYLKIADGCDNHCTYCAIPSIRGRYRSERMDDLLKEAARLSDDGVKELILVAQDVTRYGTDIYNGPRLIELVKELCKFDFEWIRLLYLEPEMVTERLIDFVASENKVAKYMDIPLQHIDDAVLKRMNRHTDEAYTRDLVKRVKVAGITLRSTFICGFPSESEEAFGKLKEFIGEGYIDFAGFFKYSREEGTPADRLSGHLSESVKRKRADELTRLQTNIIHKRVLDAVGKMIEVRYEDIDFDRQMFVGRTQRQAPDIDSEVYFTSDKPLNVGCVYRVLVTGADGVDIIGRTVE